MTGAWRISRLGRKVVESFDYSLAPSAALQLGSCPPNTSRTAATDASGDRYPRRPQQPQRRTRDGYRSLITLPRPMTSGPPLPPPRNGVAQPLAGALAPCSRIFWYRLG